MIMLLLQGDCLEIMKTLPDKSIDLFLCDLPYGCLTGGAGKERAKRTAKGNPGILGCAWDIKIDLTAFWEQVERLMKNEHTPIIHFCNARFGYDLIKSKENWFRYDLVWNKIRGVGFLNANKQPMRSHENIYVFAKKSATYYRKDVEMENAKEYVDKRNHYIVGIYGTKKQEPHKSPAGIRCAKSIIDISGAAKKGNHPTQKPDDLYAWLIERYSKEGDTILDPTAGSFASVFTAEKLNRKGIGIEMNEEFFKKAQDRSA
jgi:site-specific DNA-methyltransferase (adenine-specific)